ncbi:DUF4097 family beta strand repeat-containing protein [Chitinophaga rhizosphaerae]|uniref:DUF4097 family beta strand repeat-containing protein n=1 Tax=Chitinophaga rhizosphaerae TaxID=1864947 RepID=UPI000F815C9D|nr:DUF4097 family beta strand repeat-containing protein [Chitinophaga rhizosphaerae]
MFSKSTILFLLLCPFFAFAAKGDEEHKVVIVKEFNVGGNSSVNINSKYGKVTVYIWDKPVCKATITVTGFGKDQEQARRMTETIDVKAMESGNSVNITASSNPGSRWFSNKKDNKDYVNIDIDVYVPSKLKAMNIDSNFGDVIARKLPFPSYLKVNYGFIDVAEAGNLFLSINYTNKARIGKTDVLTVQSNYSSLNCESASEVNITSNYGNHSFGNVAEMKVQANYDEIKFKNVGSVVLRANYTDVKMDGLGSSAIISANYGDVRIRKIDKNFKSLNADVNYTDIRLGVQSGTPFRVRAEIRNGDFSADGFVFRHVSENRNKGNLSYSAITSNAGEASPLISVNGKHCDVKVGED